MLPDIRCEYFLVSYDSFHAAKMGIDLLFSFLREAERINMCFAQKIIVNCVVDPFDDNSEVLRNIVKCYKSFPWLQIEFHWRMYYDRPQTKNADGKLQLLKIKNLMNSNRINYPSFERNELNCCKDLFTSLYFDQNGFLRKCCIFNEVDLNYSIYKTDLLEIWNSQKLYIWREKWLKGIEFKECKMCPLGHGFVWG